MKGHILQYFYLFCISTMIVSCKERISLPLETQTPRLVIEGEITNLAGPYYVQFSLSKNYNSSNSIEPINPDLVTISDNLGNMDTLSKLKEGMYQTNHIVGTIGNTYYLNVNYSGESYTAQCTMNEVPNIDSIYQWYFPLDPKSKIVSIQYLDPAAQSNFYRYYLKINNAFPITQYVYNDLLTNGTKWSLSATEKEIQSGDSVTFCLLAIDNANYNYFNVLLQNSTAKTNGNATAAPINPTSNISNGAYGYFSAHSIKTKSLLVK